jgi:hypothetical protein
MLTRRYGYVIMIMPYVIVTSVIYRRVGNPVRGAPVGLRTGPPPIIHSISMLTHR